MLSERAGRVGNVIISKHGFSVNGYSCKVFSFCMEISRKCIVLYCYVLFLL